MKNIGAILSGLLIIILCFLSAYFAPSFYPLLLLLLLPPIFVLYCDFVYHKKIPDRWYIPLKSYYIFPVIFLVSFITYLVIFILPTLILNLGYCLFDLMDKVPHLTYVGSTSSLLKANSVFFYTETDSFGMFTLFFGLILSFAGSLFALAKYPYKENYKLTNEIINNIKLVLNPKFIIVYLIFTCILSLYPEFPLFNIAEFLSYNIYCKILILFGTLSIPYLTKLFPKFFEFDTNYLIKDKLKFIGIGILAYALVYAISFAVLKTNSLIEAKMPDIVKQNRILLIEDTQNYLNIANDIIQQYPDYYFAYKKLGQYYYKKGNNKLAYKYYKKAFELNEDMMEPNDYVALYEISNDKNILNKGFELYPKHSVLKSMCAMQYLNSDGYRDIKLAFEHRKEGYEAYIAILNLFLRYSKNYKEALEVARLAERNERKSSSLSIPRNGEITPNYYFFQNIMERITLICLRDFVKGPLYIASSIKINTLLDMGEIDKAEKLCNKHKDECPYLELYEAKGEFDKAEEIIEGYIKENKYDYNVVKFYYLSGQYDKLEKFYNTLEKPNELSILYYGMYLYKTGKYKEAISILEKIENRLWYSYDLYDTLSNAYEKLKNKEKQKYYLNKRDSLKIKN